MNKYMKSFLLRGAFFGGFGPVITATVYLIISFSIENFSLSAPEVFGGIVSTYLLAFIHAGCSVFNQIEEWPIAKSVFFHFLSLYIAYSVCYLVNSWIPFKLPIFLIFTASFIAMYAIVWCTVVIIAKLMEKKLNRKLRK